MIKRKPKVSFSGDIPLSTDPRWELMSFPLLEWIRESPRTEQAVREWARTNFLAPDQLIKMLEWLEDHFKISNETALVNDIPTKIWVKWVPLPGQSLASVPQDLNCKVCKGRLKTENGGDEYRCVNCARIYYKLSKPEAN